MSRSVMKLICIVSAILFVVLGILGVLAVTRALEAARNMSIIGGTGAPTIFYLLRNNMSVFYAAGVALFLFAGTGFALIFTKKRK